MWGGWHHAATGPRADSTHARTAHLMLRFDHTRRVPVNALQYWNQATTVMRKFIALTILAYLSVLAADAPPEPFTITPQIKAALDRISADSMRGNLSFLA